MLMTLPSGRLTVTLLCRAVPAPSTWETCTWWNEVIAATSNIKRN